MIERRRRTRAEKQQETYNALLLAAIDVVGEEGYAAASIVKITARANVANGTFYNYFESQQDLFNKLLLFVGDRLLDHIRARVSKTASGIERERMRITAYLDFLETTPGFIRIFHEAEVYAPAAYRKHLQQYYSGYVQALRKSVERGELGKFAEKDIDVLAYLLMGMQDFIGVMRRQTGKKPTTRAMIDIYLRLIGEGGLFSLSSSTTGTRR